MAIENTNPVGVMQGRLLPPVHGRIQAFPGKNWEDEFAIAGQLGLDCIEFIFEGDDFRKHPLMDMRGFGRIKSLEAETGVKVLSVCADYFMDHPLHGPSVGRNADSRSVLSGLIERCSSLDVKDIVIPCVDRSRIKGDKEAEEFVRSLKECLPAAYKYGINLALETDLPPSEFSRLIESLDAPNIKVNYDIGNSASLGYNPIEELDAYGQYVSDVHIKDRKRGGGTVPLGTGDADFHAVFGKLREIGFKGIYIFQAARKADGMEKQTMGEYIAFVRKFIGERAG